MNTAEIPGLSLVVPVYNEAALVAVSLERCLAVLAPRCRQLEIVVVDDGSTDGSGAIITAAAAEHREIRVLRHRRNRGLGRSLAGGISAAAGPLVVYESIDLPLAPEEIVRLAARAAATDMLVIERTSYPGATFRRRFISLANRALLRCCFPLAGAGIRDFNFAFFIHRDCWPAIRPRGHSPGFFAPEMILRARRAGLAVGVARAEYHRRPAGVSRLGSARDIFWSTRDLLAFRLPGGSQKKTGP